MGDLLFRGLKAALTFFLLRLVRKWGAIIIALILALLFM